MFLTQDELKTHMPPEIVAEISRDDDTIVESSISTAIAEARGYLGAYDTDSIFNATGSNRSAILLTFIKDIAVWHFICVSNAGIELEYREKRYNSATSWLRGVMKGDVTPDLPLKVATDSNPLKSIMDSNPKRNTYF